MKSYIFISALLLSSGIYAAKNSNGNAGGVASYEPSAKAINDRAYELEVNGELFQTSAHYDVKGNEIPLEEGDSYSRMQSTTTLRYGLSNQLQIYGGLSFRQNTSSSTTNEVTTENTASGLESYFLGSKYTFSPYGHFLFAAELRFKQTPYKNEDYPVGTTVPNDKIVLGDSGVEVTALFHGAWLRTKKHSVSGYWGYNKPGNALSPEFPWNLETAWAYSSFAFRGGIQGLTSLGSDQYKEDPSLKPNQAVGETYLYNSVNRSFIKPFVGINYAMNNWRLEGTAGAIMSGTSTDKGKEFKIALVYNTIGSTLEEKKVESFKEYGIEGTIIKVSPRLTFVKIDQGSSQDVEKGMKFDIFQTDYYGGNEMLATGIAYEVGATWTIVKILKTYKDTPIKKGMTARGH